MTEAFLNMVDNRLKNHKGIVPDPAQYPDSWNVTYLHRTLEMHTTLYQYIVNHQMQVDSIMTHLGTVSAMVTSYETPVEIVCTFCQTINHSNHKALQEMNCHKALKVEQTGGGGGSQGRGHGSSDRRGSQGTQSGWNSSHTGRCYHNWVPKEEYDKMDQDSYPHLVHDCIACGEYESNNTSSQSTVAPLTTPSAPITQVQVSNTPTNVVPDAPSILSNTPSSVCPNLASWSASTAMITPSPPLQGSTTSTHMDSGPNTLLRQLMSNASACSSTTTNDHQDSNTVTTNFNGGTYQVRQVNQSSYHLIHQTFQSKYPSALMDSGGNGSMVGSDTRLLSTVPHVHVDITGVGGTVMECLPLIQCASVVETLDEGKIILIMSQYARKPDGKTIHSKLQIEHFGGIVYDSAQATGAAKWLLPMKGMLYPYMSVMVYIIWICNLLLILTSQLVPMFSLWLILLGILILWTKSFSLTPLIPLLTYL